jgi:hypothetical protein
MTQIKAEAGIILEDHYVLDGMIAYADLYDGNNQDSDYFGDERTLEFSRSNNKSDDGEALDWSAGAGYRYYLDPQQGILEGLFPADDLWLTVLGGYSYHELNLIITDGFQTIPAIGSFAGLHSSYWAEWDGPWAGIELIGSKSKLFGTFRFEYHWADYYGSANWNLRSNFQHPKSFEQEADGRGLVFNLGAGYKLTNNWVLDFRFDIQEWKTDPGIDRTFASSGTITEIRLNEVNWESKAFMLGSTFVF